MTRSLRPRSLLRIHRLPLRLEGLEDRVTPATFVVNSLLDGAPATDGLLTLREAITAAVTNTASGDAAAGDAAALDTITFTSSIAGGTINLDAGQGELTLSGGGDVAITGPDSLPSGITISGQDAVRVFNVTSTANAVTIENLTVTRGKSGAGNDGGGMINAGPNTTLTNIVVTRNTSGDQAGAILNTGTLTINGSLLSDNSAADDGGAIRNDAGTLTLHMSSVVGNRSGDLGGAIDNSAVNGPATATITESTIAGNFAVDNGGAFETRDGATLTLRGVTVSGNVTQAGGGGFRQTSGSVVVLNSTIAHNLSGGGVGGGGYSVGGGTLSIVNSTFVGNADTSNTADGAGGISATAAATVNLVNSIVSLNSAAPGSVNDNVDPADLDTNTTNFLGGNPQLGPLEDNGGPTFTMIPFFGSPVLDTGTNSKATSDGTAGGTPLTTDQRGTGFPRIVGGTVDRGAVEFSPLTPTAVPTPPITPTFIVNNLLDAPPTVDGKLTLREAVTAATTNAASGDALAGTAGLDIIAFDMSLFGGTINLDTVLGQLTLDGGGDVSIIGPGGVPGGITISGQDAVRVFNITNAANAVTLQDLTVTRGKATAAGEDGGGLQNAGPGTTLTNVAFTRNEANDDGGAIANNKVLVLNNVLVSDSKSGDDGGGIANLTADSVLTVERSRILGNRGEGFGGGFYNTATAQMTVTDSTVAGNSTANDGGGFRNETAGSTVTLRRSAVYGNLATNEGGGIDNDGASFVATNSTVAYNLAGGNDGGGGFRVDNGSLTLVNSTVVGNADTSNNADGAGGLSAAAGPTVNLVNSVVSLNFAGPGSVNDNVDLVDLDTNTANFIANNPLLGPLQDNGGPTFTMLPFAGSPVIDGGTNGTATSDGTGGGTPLTTDQRGVTRILDGDASSTATVDQGAVEATVSPTIAFTSSSITVNEIDAPTILDAGATVTDADSSNLGGGTLTVAITSDGTSEDQLGIRNEGTGAGQIGVSGSDVTFGGTTIGTFTGGTGSDPLVVTFNSSATPAAVQALLRKITFDTSALASSTGPRTVRAVLTDCDGGTSNPALKSVQVTPAPVTVTIDQSSSQSDPTNSQPIAFTVVFSEPVTGFDSSDVVLSGSATGGTVTVTGSGSTYTVEVTGLTSDGTVVLSIPAGAATDSAGNASEASTSTDNEVAFDATAPTVTIDQSSSQSDPTNTQPIAFTVVFSEPVTGFDSSDVSLSGTATGGTVTVTGSGATYTVTVSGLTSDGTVVLSIPAGGATDSAGNASEASTSTDNTVAFDGTAPTVTVDQSSSQSDPTSSQTIRFTVIFSEPVTGFDASDISFAGSTAPGTLVATVTGSGTTFTVEVSGATGSGTVVVSVPSGAAIDSAGNESSASTSSDSSVLFARVNQNEVSRFAVGPGAGGTGTARVFNADQSEAFALDVFAGFTGGVRVAAADFNGDGVADLAVGTGPGMATLVRVIDGKTQAELFSIQPFEASFTGGVFVAAGDVTGDGKADLIITPDQGGGPRVRVFSGDGFGQLADFFGIEDPNFRGGARASAADIDGDGVADLLVAAGFGGGPRLAVFNGKSLTGGGDPVKFFGDFFVFEQTLRNGVFVASGDINGDGFADVIAGGGPGGGPRIFALSGKGLLSGTESQVANFFAGDVNNRGGIRVVAKDLDGDDRADLVVGAGAGAGSRVTAYLGSTITPNDPPPEEFAIDAFPGFTNGVFVG
jgi:hypothetical protein